MKRAVIFDFMRTLYDPLTAALYPGVSAMLSELREDRLMILYSRKERSRLELLQQLGIDGFFEGAYFVDDKNATNLLGIMLSHNIDPKECVVVGDILEAELTAGNELGATTVLLRQTVFGSPRGLGQSQEPTHTVASVSELHDLLRRID